MPNYSTPATINAEAQAGPYTPVFEGPSEITRISRGPILLENRAVYIGEWNNKAERHGIGIQLWEDGSKYTGSWMDG